VCGFAGFMSQHVVAHAAVETVGAMADAIRRRGPDDRGTWVDTDVGIALGHRRLSIVDLSAAGHQPMTSIEGRYVIAFNGEIYNHLEIRAELDKAGRSQQWCGHSDTETLLAGFEEWGIEPTLRRAVGMFALALWDRLERTLHLVRDRFGEKPLYYGWVGGAFVFGSELKALRAFPGFDNAICPDALSRYLRVSYVPAPYSIYQGVFKLEPGCVLSVRAAPPATAPTTPICAGETYGAITVHRWWSLEVCVRRGVQAPIADESEALSLLNARLGEAVRLQSVADVPLGAFLSGGVDSSLIVALMQQDAKREGRRAVKTFTVGFEDAEFDESPHAEAVAKHLGTDHHVLYVTEHDAREVLRELPEMYDEPFADSSQIPMHLVCRAARAHVTVALSGDAGDELFGGYNRYMWGPRVWNRVGCLPYAARQAIAHGIQFVSPQTWNRWLGLSGVVRPGEKLHKLASALNGVHSIDELYGRLVGQWADAARLVQRRSHPTGPQPISESRVASLPHTDLQDPAARMMFWDCMTYLPDDILCKVDRAAMAISLETRVPFLDHRIAELAWRLPMSMKIRDGQGKWALRQILYRHVPRELIERPKSGFAVPIGKWLRGPLRDWAEALLDENRLRREAHLDPAPIRAAWLQHLSGEYDWTPKIWAVLMFQAWLENGAGAGALQNARLGAPAG
jgi:asparagine synthase (glutamine-hydrolysing)